MFSALKKPIPESKYAAFPPLGVVPFVTRADTVPSEVNDQFVGKFS